MQRERVADTDQVHPLVVLSCKGDPGARARGGRRAPSLRNPDERLRHVTLEGLVAAEFAARELAPWAALLAARYLPG